MRKSPFIWYAGEEYICALPALIGPYGGSKPRVGWCWFRLSDKASAVFGKVRMGLKARTEPQGRRYFYLLLGLTKTKSHSESKNSTLVNQTCLMRFILSRSSDWSELVVVVDGSEEAAASFPSRVRVERRGLSRARLKGKGQYVWKSVDLAFGDLSNRLAPCWRFSRLLSSARSIKGVGLEAFNPPGERYSLTSQVHVHKLATDTR